MPPLGGVKQLLRQVLPPRVLYEAKRRSGKISGKQIDLQRLALIRRASDEALRSPENLTDLVDHLGLIDDYPDFIPASLRREIGEGLMLSQYPVQFGPYLASLADQRITSYLEIGTQHGGTFATTVTYLEATGHRLADALSIDIHWTPGVAEFARRTPCVRFLIQPSQDSRREIEGQRWGLIFIDGDHAYEPCRQDFEMAHRSGARIIAMHDVVDHPSSGSRRVWHEIQREHADDYSFTEFVSQYSDVIADSDGSHLGIGVAKRR